MKQANVVRVAKIVVARTIVVVVTTFLLGAFVHTLIKDAEFSRSMVTLAAITAGIFTLRWAINNWSPDV